MEYYQVEVQQKVPERSGRIDAEPDQHTETLRSEDEDYESENEKCRTEEGKSENEPEEVGVVFLADAVVEPFAVMVEVLDAP